jgi:hypothetical protein
MLDLEDFVLELPFSTSSEVSMRQTSRRSQGSEFLRLRAAAFPTTVVDRHCEKIRAHRCRLTKIYASARGFRDPRKTMKGNKVDYRGGRESAIFLLS